MKHMYTYGILNFTHKIAYNFWLTFPFFFFLNINHFHYILKDKSGQHQTRLLFFIKYIEKYKNYSFSVRAKNIYFFFVAYFHTP